MNNLAKRAAACEGWRWSAGARDVYHGRVVASVGNGVCVMSKGHHCYRASPATPDLNDPATLGCLFHLVNEAWNGNAVMFIGHHWWEVETDEKMYDDSNTASLQEALVLALESAPKCDPGV